MAAMVAEAGTRDGPEPLRFQRPSLPDTGAIERHLAHSRRARWLSNGGPCWRRLRDALAERTGACCVPVASGTAGLMAAIAAVRSAAPARDGAREALLPSFTFPATAQAAIWAGLTPRLLDVDPDDWHLDADRLERELRERGDAVALVLAVSSFGTPPPPAQRRRWERACRDAGVPLVVDSAAGFGAVAADGVPIAAQGDVEVVSFHATKPLAIGEGGAVFTRDPALCERIELAVNFGLGADRRAQLPLGLNAKMSELHAATGLAALETFDAELAARRATAESVRDAAHPSLAWQAECESSTWQFVPVAHPDREAREEAERRCRGVAETRRYYLPLHRMPAFAGAAVASGGLPRTEALAERLLCLPMASDLTAAERATLERIAAIDARRPAPTAYAAR
jgi:dTDP-4-amino-4,6-dideoxygalactose transaminase